MRTIKLLNKTRNWCIGNCIEVADTPFRRAKGLLGRKRLDPGGGLWILPSSGVHTFGMQFSIDVIGLDKELKVVRMWPSLMANRITMPSWRVKSVIELPAGAIAEMGACVGDLLVVRGRQE